MSAIPSVSYGQGGKLEIALPRAFKVRRPNTEPGKPFTDEVVWAHSYSPMEGSLVFSLYKPHRAKVMNPETKDVVEQDVAIQIFHRCMAPGTWYDVEEVCIPDIKADAAPN